MAKSTPRGGGEPNPEKGPEPLSEVLARLFALRGWGRRQSRTRLEEAWRRAVGESHAATRLGPVQRGVLEVIVSNAVLLQELAHFHKRRLLEALRRDVSEVPIRDLRFRLGTVADDSLDSRSS